MAEQYVSPHDCSECEYLAHESDGNFTTCNECAMENLPGASLKHVEADDGQPSWEQEWQDFGEVYDDEPNYI